MNCPKCGTEIPAGASFCTGCGYRFENPASDSSEPAQKQSFNAETENAEINSPADGFRPDQSSADNAEFSILGSDNISDEPSAPYEAPLKTAQTPAASFEMPENTDFPSDRPENSVPESQAAPFFSVDSAESKPDKPESDLFVKPMSTWSYIWREIIFLIPIVNIIMLFIFAFAEGINKNSRSFARSRLIYALLITVAVIVGMILFYVYSDAILSWLRGALQWMLTVLG